MNIIVTILAIIGGFCVASFLGVLLLWAYTVIGDWRDKRKAKDYTAYVIPVEELKAHQESIRKWKEQQKNRKDIWFDIDEAMDTGKDTQVY